MADFNPTWWQAQNTDPLYLQQVADVFGQVPGDNASFRNPALRAITQQGAIGNDRSGFIAKLNEAFRGRNIASPFSSDELAQAATAAQQLNEGEVSESGQIQRRLSDRTRTETNDLAARGILQSGENAYRAGERNLLGNQLNYSSFQGLLDRIEGLSAGKLAAEQAHKQNLWKYLESAIGRMSAAEAARRAAEKAANTPSSANGPPTQSGGGGVPISNWVPPVGSPIPGGINSGVTPPGGLLPSAGVPSGTWGVTETKLPPEIDNSSLFSTMPPISSSQGKGAGSLGVPIGVPYTPYKPPAPPKPNPLPKVAPPKPNPLPKVSGAFTSPAFATTKYRNLAGKV